jgi:hypothetical protein
VVQLPNGTETPTDKLNHPEVPTMWSVNLAKRGLAFPPNHQYFNGVPEKVIEKGKGLIDDYTEDDIRTLLYNKDFYRAYQVVQIHPKYQKITGFTLEELTSINHYTYKGNNDLNAELRTGNLSKFNAAFEKVLNASLNKLPNDTQLNYFRGVALNKDVIDTYSNHWKKGIPKTEDYFMSTSTDVNIARKFGQASDGKIKCIFKVRTKNGKDISKLSNATSESEVLLKSHSEFNIRNVKEVKTKNETYYEIDMEETD